MEIYFWKENPSSSDFRKHKRSRICPTNLSLQIFLKILCTYDWISVVNVVVSSRDSISPLIGSVKTIK